MPKQRRLPDEFQAASFLISVLLARSKISFILNRLPATFIWKGSMGLISLGYVNGLLTGINGGIICANKKTKIHKKLTNRE